MRARLRRYALWQLRDYLFERGLPLLIVCALFGWVTLSTTDEVRGRFGPDELSQLAAFVWRGIVPQVALFGTILALNGIVATDLRQGYFRFLFAKPLAAPAYYAQAFAVHGLGLAVVVAAFFAAFSWALGVAAPLWAVGYALLYFVALGGIIFLASSASVAVLGRFDWLAASAMWVGGLVARAMAQRGERWAQLLSPLLPPSWRTDELLAALLGGAPPPMAATLHLLGYGAACFLLGLIVLRYRPLAA
jgi:hypothetical protein